MQLSIHWNLPNNLSHFLLFILNRQNDIPNYWVLPRIQKERPFELVNEGAWRVLTDESFNVVVDLFNVFVTVVPDIIKLQCFIHRIVNSIEIFMSLNNCSQISSSLRTYSRQRTTTGQVARRKGSKHFVRLAMSKVLTIVETILVWSIWRQTLIHKLVAIFSIQSIIKFPQFPLDIWIIRLIIQT